MGMNRLAALTVLILAAGTISAADQAGERRRPPMPPIAHPTLFGTPEADRILSALPGLPSGQPLESRTSSSLPVLAYISTPYRRLDRLPRKRLGYNLDMNFIIVPPNQPLGSP